MVKILFSWNLPCLGLRCCFLLIVSLTALLAKKYHSEPPGMNVTSQQRLQRGPRHKCRQSGAAALHQERVRREMMLSVSSKHLQWARQAHLIRFLFILSGIICRLGGEMAHYSCWTDGQIKGDISVCYRAVQAASTFLGSLNVLFITAPDQNLHGFLPKTHFFLTLEHHKPFSFHKHLKGGRSVSSLSGKASEQQCLFGNKDSETSSGFSAFLLRQKHTTLWDLRSC